MNLPNRIWVCEECNVVFSDEDKNSGCESKWGHICKAKKYKEEHRCESYLKSYVED